MNFGIFGTNRVVCNEAVSVLKKVGIVYILVSLGLRELSVIER